MFFLNYYFFINLCVRIDPSSQGKILLLAKYDGLVTDYFTFFLLLLDKGILAKNETKTLHTKA